MPSRIKTEIQDINPLSSATDQWIMAQEEFWGDESKNDATPIAVASDGTVTGGDFVKVQPLIVEASLQQSKELVEFMYKTGHAGATKKGAGPETIIGGASFAMTGNATAVLFQMLTQDRNPAYVYLGRLLAAADIDVTAASTDISGTSTITIASDLSTVSQLLEIRIRLTSATSGTAGTPATITVVGVDGAGVAYTTVVEYSTPADFASVWTSQKTATVTSITPSGFGSGSEMHVTAHPYTSRQAVTVPAGVEVATTVDVTGTGASDLAIADDLKTTEYPVQITVTPNAGSALAAGVIRATHTFVGTGHNGNLLAETVSLTGSGLPAAKTTVGFFSTIEKHSATGWAAGSTVSITARDTSAEVTFEPQDEELVSFASVEYSKASVPFVYRSLCANQMTIGNPNRNSPLLAVIDFHGRKVEPYTNLAGQRDTAAFRTDATALLQAAPDIFTSWQQNMSVAGVTIPTIDMTHTINQGLNYSGVITGTPYEEARPYRAGKRAAMSEGNIIFSKENNIAQDYNENVTYEEVAVQWENIAEGTFPNLLRIEYDEAQLTTVGDPASPALDRLLLPFGLSAFSTKFGVPTDFRVVAVYSEYDLVRQY